MKIICVTGAPGSDVNKVADIFFASGVQPAEALRQDPSFTLASWHEKVVAAAGSDKALQGQVQQPGRFWEQLATNLFMENMRYLQWAWADARSVWLLEFWQQFEPNLHFVLVYTSPQRALAEALAAEREHGADTAALMAAWEAHQKEILRFHHRNPKRTILVDAAECSAVPAALLEACAARWDLDLAPVAGQLPSPAPAAALVGYLAEQLRQTHPGLQVLQQELEASLHALLPEPAGSTDVPDLFAAVEDYRQVRSAAARADVLALQIETLSGQLATLETGRAGLQAEYDAAVLRAQRLGAELAQSTEAARGLAGEKSEYERRIGELKQALDGQHAEVATLKAANAEARSESEQLLLQMHQLQEEMERWYLENKTLGEIKAKKKQTIDELNNKVTQYESSVATLKKELEAAKANKATEKEKADALAALTAAKKELDAARQGIKRLEDEQRTVAANAAQQQLALDAAKRAAKEAEQENALLLVQLHQVQEELEHYFLEHKNAVKQSDALQLRWQRMLERNPDYCDYRSLELLGKDEASARTSWRFTDLNAAGRAFPVLRFDTIVTEGVAAFAFARDDQAPGAPEALEALGSADWLLLPTLCRVLDEALQAPAGSAAQLGQDMRDTLREALAALVEVIDSAPAVLRFDRIALKREQVNPDYEHLWLQLGNLSLGDQRWSDFEFRLSCANVRPGKFGAYPKLEFPSEVGAVLFDSWFVESYDDFGEKLELRFALPEAMDMAVWEQLSQNDHAMMQSLIAALPRMLAGLGSTVPTLARPFADWQQLTSSVQSILAKRTGAALHVPAPVTAPIVLPSLDAARSKKAGSARARNAK